MVTVFNGVRETVPGWGGAAGLRFLMTMGIDRLLLETLWVFGRGFPKQVELQKAPIGQSVLPEDCIKTEEPAPNTM